MTDRQQPPNVPNANDLPPQTGISEVDYNIQMTAFLLSLAAVVGPLNEANAATYANAMHAFEQAVLAAQSASAASASALASSGSAGSALNAKTAAEDAADRAEAAADSVENPISQDNLASQLLAYVRLIGAQTLEDKTLLRARDSVTAHPAGVNTIDLRTGGSGVLRPNGNITLTTDAAASNADQGKFFTLTVIPTANCTFVANPRVRWPDNNVPPALVSGRVYDIGFHYVYVEGLGARWHASPGYNYGAF